MDDLLRGEASLPGEHRQAILEGGEVRLDGVHVGVQRRGEQPDIGIRAVDGAEDRFGIVIRRGLCAEGRSCSGTVAAESTAESTVEEAGKCAAEEAAEESAEAAAHEAAVPEEAVVPAAVHEGERPKVAEAIVVLAVRHDDSLFVCHC